MATPDVTDVPERSPRSRRLAVALLWLGLLLVTVGSAALHVPQDVLVPDQRTAFPPADIQPEQGLAWIVPFDPDVPSSREGHSPLRMFEDDRELTTNSIHDQIRTDGGGQFSHWGPWIRFATTDGSDPRSNGRTYVLTLPGSDRPWVAPSIVALVAVALLLVVAGGVATVRAGAVSRAQLIALLLAFGAAGATAWRHGPWLSWTGDLAALAATLGTDDVAPEDDGEPVAHALGRVGNTTRLLPPGDEGEVRFQALHARPPQAEPISVAFAPQAGVESQAGRYRLLPGGPGLVAALPAPIAIPDITEIVLPVLLVDGDRLLLELLPAPGAPALDGVELPFTAATTQQHLRIHQPLAGYTGPDSATVGALRLSCPATQPHPTTLGVDHAQVAGPMAVFGRTTHGFQSVEVDKDSRPSLWQSVAGEISVPWPSDAGRLLKGAVTAFGRGAGASVPVQIAVEDATGRRFELSSGELAPRNAWGELRASLPSELEPTALVLSCPELPADTVLAWSGWRLVDASRPPQRVLIALMDTLRADALGVLGHPDSPTPHLDALAGEGVAFARCYSQSFCTRPSMPSIMTGRYVASTGVHELTQRLPRSYVTLAEAFAAAGFHTVAHIANTNAGPDAGLDQGWDQLRLVFLGPELPDTDTHLQQHVLPHLDDLFEEDLLVYVHLMEAHGPYGGFDAPASPYVPPPGAVVAFDPHLDRPWNGTPTDSSRVALYHADVAGLDRGFGAFLETLLGRWEQGRTPSTIVAVLSDHGEFLGEYGQWGHDFYRLVPEINQVPLILRAPDRLPAGRVCDVPVENIDAAPTLLALAGIAPSMLGEIEGRSLLPLIHEDDRSGHGQALASGGSGFPRLLSVFADSGVLVGVNDELVGRLGPEGAAPGDPPLAPEHLRDTRASLLSTALEQRAEEGFEQLWQRYLESRESIRRSLWTLEDESVTALDPRALQHLEAMGYLDR